MWKRYAICALAVAAMHGVARGDTIVIDGETHTGVKIVTVSTRYYIKFSDGAVATLEKEKVKPWEIAFGDAPLPEAPTAAAPPAVPEPTPEPEPAPEPPAVKPAAPATAPRESAAPASISEPAPEPHTPRPATPVTAPPERPVPLPVPPLISAEGPLSAGAKRITVSESETARERLEINALVLRCGDVTAAFCAVDAAAVNQALFDGVVRRLEAAGSAIGRDNLFLSATGVPTGRYPGMARGPAEEAVFGPHNPDAVAEAAVHITLAITEAERSASPAVLRIAEAEAPQYHRVRGAGSTTEDSSLSALAVAAPDGAPIAYLVNYALHPPVAHDTAVHGRRGAPGALAEKLREAAGAPVPVLFLNGAAGDIEAVPPSGESVPEQEAALGDALARAVLAALEESSPRGEVRLARRAREAYLPPTLVPDLAPGRVLLHEVWINDAVFLSVPGIPAAQIGLLLRVQSMRAGAEQAFLVSLCGGYLGFQPTIEEFFAVTDTGRYGFHGPLFVQWFSENYLTDVVSDQKPLWTNVRALDRYASGFRMAQARGTRERGAIAAQWRKAADAVDNAATALLDEAGEVPAVFREVLNGDSARAMRAQLAAVLIREHYAGFSAEQRAILMGVAEGAGLPFDAVLWLQVLAQPGMLPLEVRGALKNTPAAGMDFLS